MTVPIAKYKVQNNNNLIIGDPPKYPWGLFQYCGYTEEIEESALPSTPRVTVKGLNFCYVLFFFCFFYVFSQFPQKPTTNSENRNCNLLKFLYDIFHIDIIKKYKNKTKIITKVLC